MGVDNTKAKLLRIIEELSQISANQAEMIDYLKQENESLEIEVNDLQRAYDALLEQKIALEHEVDGLGYTE